MENFSSERSKIVKNASYLKKACATLRMIAKNLIAVDIFFLKYNKKICLKIYKDVILFHTQLIYWRPG